MKPIIVTGAAGFIGSHTCEQLLAAGYPVVGVDNFRSGLRENLRDLTSTNFTFLEADVAEPDTFDSLASDFSPSAIVHLAALVQIQECISKPELNIRLNIDTTNLLAEAARRHRIPKIVFASSAAVYGNGSGPISPYGEAKLASERILTEVSKTSAVVVRCLRYFNVFGPRQSDSSPYSGVITIFTRCLRENHPVIFYGDGWQTRDFISVHDVARANMLGATKPGGRSATVDICTGRAISLWKILELISNLQKQHTVPRLLPARPGDIKHSIGNPQPARADLNFEAAWSLDRGIAELISPNC